MAAKTLLKEATNPNNDVVDQVAALNRLSELLEAEERRFVDLIGDPQWSPNQRGHFAIGRMLAGLKDEEEMFDNITEHWLQNRRAPLEQCVAALRFLLACLTCWQFQFPLTEDSLVEKLHEWVREEGARPPTRHDPAPADEQALLEEARHTYAIGLLAVTLGNEQRCDEAVRNGLVSRLACYLKQAILGTRAQEAAAGNEPVRSAAASVADAAGLVKDPQAGILGEKAHKRHVDDPPSSSSLVAEANAGPIQQPPFPPPQHIQEQAMALRTLRERYCVQCLACMGEYLECLGPVLAEQGLAVLCELMRSWRTSHAGIVDALRLLCSLVAHRRFAELFVDAGGIQLLLALPQTPHTRGGLSLALFGFASLPLAFERVCALPTAIPSQLVETVLALLSSGFDPARKNASLFLGAALHFRAVLDAFDRQDGLRRLLALLRTCVLLLRGANAADIRVEKQVGYHASHALQQYFRTHLVLHVATLKRRQAGQGAPKQAVLPAYRPVDVGQDAVDATIWALETDRKLYEAFVRSKWAALEDFMDYGGPGLMLDLIQACPGERYFNEMAQYALDVLHTATLMPYTRRNVVGCIASNQRSGMAVVLSAAGGQAYLADHEVMQSALLVLANCVSAPPSLAPLLPPLAQAAPKGGAPAEVAAATPSVGPWRSYRYLAGPSGSPPREVQASTSAEPMGAPAAEHAGTAATVGQHIEGSYQFARAALRANNGIRVLLGLLQSRSSMPASHVDKLRALTLRTLLGLARDPSIRHILAKLQVGRLMAELVHEPAASGSMRRLPASAGEEGPGDTYPGANWHAAFNKMALELIALTTSAGVTRAGTAAASDAAAPALHKIERAAIAAATHITYPPAELLLVIQDHLVASGLHDTAATLWKEANLAAVQGAAQPSMAQQAPMTEMGSRAASAALAAAHLSAATGASTANTPGGAPSAVKKLHIAPALLQHTRHAHTPATSCKAPQSEPKQLRPDASTPSDLLNTSKSRKRRASSVLPAPAHPTSRGAPGPQSAPCAAAQKPDRGQHLQHLQHPSGDFPVQAAAGQDTEGREESKAVPSASQPLLMQSEVALQASCAPATAGSDDTAQHHGTTTRGDQPDASTSGAGHAPARQHSQGFNTPGPPKRVATADAMFTPEAATPAAAAPSRIHPQLANLPRKGPLADAAARSSAAAEPACATPAPLSRASIRAAVQSPPETTGRLGEPAPLRNHSTPAAIVSSKLNSIVMQYLRHQHRQACMAAAAPISTLPPMSLLRPHTLPQAKRTLEAPVNVTARTLRRQASGQHGGFGGRRQQRHFLYSRFRHLRSVRDADASVFKSCTFLHKSSVLVVGTHAGELKFTDPRTAEVVEVYEAHSAPVNMLKVHERGSTSLLLSSSREQVILWNANNMETGPLATWEGCRGGVFSSTGSRAACIGFPFRQAFIYDVATCSALLTLDDANAGTGSGERSWRSGRDSMCYSPSDELLLWGPQLWDPRAPRAIHRFDQFSDMTGGGTFQMAGLEIIMNSEVWDLRTFKLLRSAPCLDATTLTFNAAGDVMYATLRRTTDDLGNALHPRRAKHALHTAFRTVDATDYTEIATLDADQRCVLDLCVDPEDAYIGVVTVEPQEGMSSSARIYGVGRRRLQDDDSENEDENDDGRPSDDEDESQDEDDGPAAYAELLGDDIAHEGQGREAPPQHADAPEDASNPGDASDGLGRDADEAESDADIESDLDLSELAGSADSEGGDEDSDPEGAMDWAEGAYLAGEDDMSSDGEWATDDGEPESDAPSFESDYGDDESD